MKKVTLSEFIAIVKAASASKAASGTNSINGEIAAVTYFVGTILKNGYYAKLQNDKSVKNPLWGRDLTAIKSYKFNFAASYEKAKEKDGIQSTESGDESESDYISVVPNVIYQLKSDPTKYYIQVMANAYKADYYLDGQKVGHEILDIIKPFAKPNKGNGLSAKYKKLNLTKLECITFDGETYVIEG